MRILTVDIGTTNVKAAIVDEQGRVTRVASREVPLLSPEPGAAEHSPLAILGAVSETSNIVSRNSTVDAVALSCYQHGLLVVDKEFRPLTNVITHMDWRSTPYVSEIESRAEALELYRRTGCPPLFVYALPKIIWLKSVKRDVSSGNSRFLLLKDFIIAKAVGEPFIDYGNASGSQLFNIHSLKWDDLALELASISEEQLAEPVEGARVLCELKGKGAKFFGVKDGTPLVPGTFDGAAQNFGYLLEKTDEGVLNLGTTAVVRLLSGETVLDLQNMRTFCYYAASGRWAFGGSTNNGGSVLKWLRDSLGNLEVSAAELLNVNPYELLCKEAENAPPGSNGLLFIPFMAGERFPFRDPYSRGVLIGLRYDHRKSHLIRAFLEGVAFTVKALVEAIDRLGFKLVRLYGSGGGMKSRLWAEIIANATGIPIIRVKEGEHASNRGLAALAFTALGSVRDFHELNWSLEAVDTVEPEPGLVRAYDEAYSRFLEAYRQLAPLFKKWEGGETRIPSREL